jgi:Flp pilus assembly pilin Flp
MKILFKQSRRRLGSRSGQTAAEYAIIAGMLMASLAILVVFLVSFREYGGRILELVASEYP